MSDTPLTRAEIRAEIARLRAANAEIRRQIDAQQSLIEQLQNQLPEEHSEQNTSNNNNNSAPAAGGKKSRKRHNKKSKRQYKYKNM